MAIADAHRQVVAVRSAETVPVNRTVGESQSIGRVENAVQRVQGLIRTLKDALERTLTTRIRSNDPIFQWTRGFKTKKEEWTRGRKPCTAKFFKTATQGDRLGETLHTQ